ncbi:hypothetical protein HGO37_18670 [Rhizobium sp. CG4]|uniref:hypothetical protein n=1 Tax=unclassified Rhizobium TaxID=2613769 RepID=UPI0020341E71|nr:hypothetical protein [Rhizobium sp. BIGb0125]MCM2457426.1 hypothetical protein [Rhizobium sp. CG4]MCS4244982.1 hypothetical protein [Rhizobium sp. BIGb0125]
MSKYFVNKFLFMVDRDPALLRQYTIDPHGLVARWEQTIGATLLSNSAEESTIMSLTVDERNALTAHDFVALFEMGAHFFLNLTLFIGIYDEPYAARSGPLSFHREFAGKLAHWQGHSYPSVAT